MTKEPAAPMPAELSWSDTRLVRECLHGNDKAWSALIDKYKNLIYSVAIRYDLSREDAADVFQSVVVDLLSELGRVREPEAMPKWLMQVTAHKCLQWRRDQQRSASPEGLEADALPDGTAAISEEIIHEAECEQMLRDALKQVSPRCRELIQMLFFESPARPYQEVAERLAIATGSMGFIRRRCLDRLRALLEKAGFP